MMEKGTKTFSKNAQRELKDLKAGQVVDKGVTEVSASPSSVASALAGAAARSPLRGTAAKASASGVVGVTEIPIHTTNNTPVQAVKHKRSEEPTGETPEAKILQTQVDKMDADIGSPRANLFGASGEHFQEQGQQQRQQGPTTSLSTDEKLQFIMDNMATKDDLRNTVRKEVKQEVSAAVAPLEARVARLELSDPTSDSNDPARTQVSFVGFASVVTAAERLRVMEDLVAEFRDFRATGFGHNYTGPFNAQTMTVSSYVSFSDRKTAAAFLQAVKAGGRSELTLASGKVRVLPL